MAIDDAYATVADYRSVKDKTATDDDGVILRQLKAVSRVLDRKLGQCFNKDAAVTTRLYGPNDEIAPIASTTGLIIKASTGAPIVWASVDALTVDEDFELLPLNALAEGRPITAIRLLGWNSSPPSIWQPKTYFPNDYRWQVTAIHGWPAAPDAIWWAAIELCSILRAESIFTTGRVQELDQVVDASPQARALLKSLFQTYSRYPVAVG